MDGAPVTRLVGGGGGGAAGIKDVIEHAPPHPHPAGEERMGIEHTGGVVVVRVLVGGLVGSMVVVGMEHGSKGVSSEWVCERVTTPKEVSKEVEGVHGGI